MQVSSLIPKHHSINSTGQLKSTRFLLCLAENFISYDFFFHRSSSKLVAELALDQQERAGSLIFFSSLSLLFPP